MEKKKTHNLSYCLFLHLVVSGAEGWESRTRQTNPPFLALWTRWLRNCLCDYQGQRSASGSALRRRKTPFPTVQTCVWCLLRLRGSNPRSPGPRASLATAALAVADGAASSKRIAKQTPDEASQRCREHRGHVGPRETGVCRKSLLLPWVPVPAVP